MLSKIEIENLKDIIIIGSETCNKCFSLKEEIENYYPNISFKFKLFKDLESNERKRIRNWLFKN